MNSQENASGKSNRAAEEEENLGIGQRKKQQKEIKSGKKLEEQKVTIESRWGSPGEGKESRLPGEHNSCV